MNNTKYFSRSWALITRDKGWIKPLLVMAAATFVPIVGEFGNNGYALEYARLTAWGVDGAPKQKNVDIGTCIKSGARGFVVSLGWGLVVGLATSVISAFAGIFPGGVGVMLSLIVSLATSFLMTIVGAVIYVAQLRCSIYESIAAGYHIDRIFELIKRDTSGFTQIFLINLVCTIILGVIGAIFAGIVVVMFMPLIMSASSGYISDYEILHYIGGSMIVLFPACMVFGYVISLLSNLVRMIVLNAVGLWMRQYNVPTWGRSEDPLPEQGPWTQATYAQPQEPQYPQDAYYAQPQEPVQPAQSRPDATYEPAPAPAPQPDPTPQPAPPEDDAEAVPLVKVLRDRIEPKSDDAEKTADDIYDEFLDVLEENDHVDGD